MPKLSIIIPIYNAEKCLPRCVDSVLKQEYTDYELLLINDGSTDSSLVICEQYAKTDSRIKVLDKPNGGVSSARNKGLEFVQGEWVMFVDADDFLIYDSLKNTFDELQSVDLAIGAIQFSNNLDIENLRSSKVICEEEISEFIATYISHPLLSGPWAKLYKREILEHEKLRFDESLCFGEDAVFVKEYLLHINAIQVLDGLLYYYENIGDGVYKKYNKSFTPIFDYYLKMSDLYTTLENRYQIELSKHELVGVTYNLLVQCIKKDSLKEWAIIKQYLNVSDVKAILRKRNSLHINVLLYLATYPKGYLFGLYFHMIEKLKLLRK